MNRFGYGWRGKFGYINPSISDTVVLEFYKMLPEGVLVTSVDQKAQNVADSEFDKIIQNMEEAAQVLDYEEVGAITIGGTPPLLRNGFDTPEKVIERFEEKFKKPFSTTATSEIKALSSLKLRKLILVTPYTPQLNNLLRQYLEYKNFEIVHVKGANIQKHSDMSRHTGEQLYQLVKEAAREAKSGFDGIHIGNPRWPVIDMVEILEADFGVPVVATCQALVWEALNMLCVRQVKAGAGSLFNEFRVEAQS